MIINLFITEGLNELKVGSKHYGADTHTRAHTDTCKHLGGGLSQNATCHRPRIAVTSPLNNKNHLQRQTEGGGGRAAGGPAGRPGRKTSRYIDKSTTDMKSRSRCRNPTQSNARARQRRLHKHQASCQTTHICSTSSVESLRPSGRRFFFFCRGRSRREPLMAKRCCVADFGACSPWLTSFFLLPLPCKTPLASALVSESRVVVLLAKQLSVGKETNQHSSLELCSVFMGRERKINK